MFPLLRRTISGTPWSRDAWFDDYLAKPSEDNDFESVPLQTGQITAHVFDQFCIVAHIRAPVKKRDCCSSCNARLLLCKTLDSVGKDCDRNLVVEGVGFRVWGFDRAVHGFRGRLGGA